MADTIDTHDWARDIPRKRFSSPYNFKENVEWILNNVLGPSKRYKKLTEFIPRKTTLNSIQPEYSLGFVGDIMRMRGNKLHFSPEIHAFFKPVDFLIGNFEGTIAQGKRVFMSQTHSEETLDALSGLFPPERFVLACANNHSGDFFWSEFNNSYRILKDHGFLAIGRKDEPSITLKDKINVLSCTAWSNQPHTYRIPYLDEVESSTKPSARFNFLYPHWGYELQLYPNPKQIESGKKLLLQWDAIVGHHSHCPQPVASYLVNDINKLISYSLGNFCFATSAKYYHHGMIVKVKVGPGRDGEWQVGDVEWEFTRIHRIDSENIEIKIENKCKFFKSI